MGKFLSYVLSNLTEDLGVTKYYRLRLFKGRKYDIFVYKMEMKIQRV